MSWKHWTRVVVRTFVRRQRCAEAFCRTSGQALRLLKRGSQSWHDFDVNKLANKSYLRDYGNSRTPFEPGLFNVDVSVTDAGGLATSSEGLISESNQATKKHSYISYGSHLNPDIFSQFSEGKTLDNGRTKQEIFHPKLSPRLFYREADGYKNTAIIYPRLREEIMVADVQLAERTASELLGQLLYEVLLNEKGVTKLLEILHQCGDKFLVRLAGDDRFSKLTELLCDLCFELRTDEFVKVLTLFARVQIRTSNPALELYETESLRRCPDWDVNTSLLVCDALRLIGRRSKVLNNKVFELVENQLGQLTKCHVVQLIYLIGENRHCQRSLLVSLQERILDEMDNLTIMELGSICQGFFKCKTRLKPLFITALCERLQKEDLGKIHSFFLIGILKVFREAYFGHRELFEHIANSVGPRLQTFPISALMHVLLTFSTLHIYNEQLLETGAEELLRRVEQCRCKDASKFLWSFATLNHHPQNSEHFFRVMIGRMIQLLKEYEDFPLFFISGLLALAYLNIYPAELLDIAFSKTFLRKIDEYATKSGIYPLRDLFLLHTSVKIDCPDYQGNSLNKHFFMSRPSSRIMFGNLSYELSQRPVLGEVASSVAIVLGGDQFVKLGFSLPHMKSADIEICLDSNNTPISLQHADETRNPLSSQLLPQKMDKSVPLDTSSISSLSGKNVDNQASPTVNGIAVNSLTGVRTAHETLDPVIGGISSSEKAREYSSSFESKFDVPRPVQDNRIVILVWSRNHFHYNGKKLLGLHSMKKRQLKKLGYKTLDIPYFKWANLTESEAREDYIRQKIFS